MQLNAFEKSAIGYMFFELVIIYKYLDGPPVLFNAKYPRI